MSERNPKGSNIRSNFQLGKEIDQLYIWFRELDRKIEHIEEYLHGPKPKPQSEKIGLDKFLDE
tara:strand:+ start:279 stop:467 length:189 start_codon:yes stop_codon:yes gene_type:complete